MILCIKRSWIYLLISNFRQITNNYENLIENQINGITETFNNCMQADVVINNDCNLFNMMYEQRERDAIEYPFYYHFDHLGSTTYLTDRNGNITQTLTYLPYGEDWVDITAFQPNYNNLFDTTMLGTYSFNGKEKDYESGFHYYGARYYASELGIWLSTDPMSDKYPSLSPYNYCADNPVKFIDPKGEEIWISDEATRTSYKYENGNLYNKDGTIYKIPYLKNNFLKSARNALRTIQKSDIGKQMLSDLQNSKNEFTIVNGLTKPGADSQSNCFDAQDISKAYMYAKKEVGEGYQEGGSGGIIHWNPNGNILPTIDGGRNYNYINLGHELFHAWDANSGLLDSRVQRGSINNGEWQAIYNENTLRSQLNLPLRTYYGIQQDIYGHYIGGSGQYLLNEDKSIIKPTGYLRR